MPREPFLSGVQNENAMDQETPPEDVQDSRGNRRSHSPSSQTPSDKTDSSSKSLMSTFEPFLSGKISDSKILLNCPPQE
jgi:hypothetical protein